MIEATGLVKRYGDKVAVDGVSFRVPPGVVTWFLGPNGAGKSTTMRMIIGLDAPSGGSVTVNGRHCREHRAPLHEVGAMLEARAFQNGRSARNHLLVLAHTHGISSRRVDQLLELVGLSDVASKRIGGFSLGMGQRLGIAAALLGDRATLILDEPVNGLDPDGILWVRHLLRRLARQGRTMFVSSHPMSEMALTADRLIVIGRGRIIADVSVDEFTRSAGNASVHVCTPGAARLAELLTGPGVEVVTLSAQRLEVIGMSSDVIGDLAAEHAIAIHELTRSRPRWNRRSCASRTSRSSPDPRRRSGRDGERERRRRRRAAGERRRGPSPARLSGAGVGLGVAEAAVAALVVGDDGGGDRVPPGDRHRHRVVDGERLAPHAARRAAALRSAGRPDVGFSLAQLAVGVLGVLIAAGEYPGGMIRASLGAVPQRLPMLWAKVALLTTVTLATMLPTSIVTFFVSQRLMSSEHIQTTWDSPGVARAVIGIGLYLTVVAALAVGPGAIMRNVAGGIGVFVGVILVVPVIASAMPQTWGDRINKWLPSNAGQALMSFESDNTTLSPWRGFIVFCLYTIATVTIAAVLLRRRDA